MRANGEPTCLDIECIAPVNLFNHERLIFRNIQSGPERLLKVREGAVCIMDRQPARVFSTVKISRGPLCSQAKDFPGAW